MPVLSINTNLADAQIPRDSLPTLTDLVASLLSKPAAYVAVQVIPNQSLSFGGSDAPAALIELRSIGGLNKSTNNKIASVLTKKITELFGIPPDRFYIEFNDLKADCVSYEGRTFG